MNNIKTKEAISKINDILMDFEWDEATDILASVVGELGDLEFIQGLLKSKYDPSITNQYLVENCCYTEGNEEAGHIPISCVLEFVKEILEASDDEYGIEFKDNFITRTPNEELEEWQNKNVDWYDENEEEIKNKLIGFEVS